MKFGQLSTFPHARFYPSDLWFCVGSRPKIDTKNRRKTLTFLVITLEYEKNQEVYFFLQTLSLYVTQLQWSVTPVLDPRNYNVHDGVCSPQYKLHFGNPVVVTFKIYVVTLLPKSLQVSLYPYLAC